MKASNALSTLRVVSIAFGMIVSFGVPTFGQEAQLQKDEASAPKPAPVMNEVLRHNIEDWILQGRGMPDDWSHHHLVFSNPGTEEDAIANGTHDRWLSIVNDPRYILQQMKRDAAGLRQASRSVSAATEDAFPVISPDARHESKKKKKPLKTDWSESMNSSSATVGADNYPSGISFAISNPTTANCAGGTAPDYVVYNTSVGGSSTQASIIAYDNLYATTCSGTVPQTYWAYNTGGDIETSVVLSLDGTQVAFIHSASPASLVLLKWRATTGSFTGITHGTTLVTVPSGTCTTATAGSPIYGVGIPQGDTIATCSTTVLTLAIAATNSTSETITYSNATAAAPVSPTAVGNGAYKACAAPCMTTIAFSNGQSDVISSPFYDYADDVIYVGDAGGSVHKFTNVFLGGTAPAEAGSPWPKADGSGKLLTSVVWDSVSQLAYWTNQNTSVEEITSAGTLTSTANLNCPPTGNNSEDIQEGPIVDSTNGKVYLFAEGANDNCVVQIPTSFTAGSSPFTYVEVGASRNSNTEYLYGGDFDNAFYTTGTGNLYVCGNNNGDATIYQVPISSGTMSTTANAGPVISTTSRDQCSPVTEIYNTSATNGPYDWIYAGVRGAGADSGCGGGGCIMNFIVTAWQASNAYSLNQEILDSNLNIQKVTKAGTSGATEPTKATWKTTTGLTTTDGTVTWTCQGTMLANSVGAAYTGGTSGIIVDNTGAATGASNIYFSTLGSEACTGGTAGCAVQASQSAP